MTEAHDAFRVLVDLPSLSACDLQLSRSGTCTRVRGERSPPYSKNATELRGERLYGRFVLAVRVPDAYETRWQEASLANGVLRLTYRADVSEEEQPVTLVGHLRHTE